MINHTVFISYVAAACFGIITSCIELFQAFPHHNDRRMMFGFVPTWLLLGFNAFVTIIVYFLLNYFLYPNLNPDNTLATGLLVGISPGIIRGRLTFFRASEYVKSSLKLEENSNSFNQKTTPLSVSENVLDASFDFYEKFYQIIQDWFYLQIFNKLAENKEKIVSQLVDRNSYSKLLTEVRREIALLKGISSRKNIQIAVNQYEQKCQKIEKDNIPEEEKRIELAKLLIEINMGQRIASLLSNINQRSDTNNILQKNEKSFTELLRSIVNYSDDNLELKFAVCNSLQFQSKIIMRLERILDNRVKLITLKQNDLDLYETISKATETIESSKFQQLPYILIVNGLEQVIERENLVRSARQRSDELKEKLHCIVILWLSTDLEIDLIRNARNFYSIGTPVEFFLGSEN